MIQTLLMSNVENTSGPTQSSFESCRLTLTLFEDLDMFENIELSSERREIIASIAFHKASSKSHLIR